MALFDLAPMPGILGGPEQGPSTFQRILNFLGRGARGAAGVLGTISAGPDDPRLSPEANDRIRKLAMIQGGLATMASDAPTGLGAFAQGSLYGQSVAGAAREDVYAETQTERIRRALQDPEILGRLTPNQRALVRVLPPQEAMQIIVQALSSTPDPVVVGEGAALVDPQSGAVLFRQDAGPEIPSELQGIAQLMGVDPAALQQLPEAQRAALLNTWENFRRAGATNIALNTGQQTAEGITQIAVDDYRQISENAARAQDALGSLSIMRSLMAEGMSSGRLDALSVPFRGYAVSFGFLTPDQAQNLSQQQLFRAISNRLALEARSRHLTGQMSDRDIVFLTESVPSLSNTPEGNRMLIEILERQARRQIELANLAAQYVAENGTLDHRWFLFKNQWLQDNPLYGDLAQPAPWESRR